MSRPSVPPTPPENALGVVARHRRQIEQSPGIGVERQTYALDVLDDIERDLRSGGSLAGEPPVELYEQVASAMYYKARSDADPLWIELPEERAADWLEYAEDAIRLVWAAARGGAA